MKNWFLLSVYKYIYITITLHVFPPDIKLLGGNTFFFFCSVKWVNQRPTILIHKLEHSDYKCNFLFTHKFKCCLKWSFYKQSHQSVYLFN